MYEGNLPGDSSTQHLQNLRILLLHAPCVAVPTVLFIVNSIAVHACAAACACLQEGTIRESTDVRPGKVQRTALLASMCLYCAVLPDASQFMDPPSLPCLWHVVCEVQHHPHLNRMCVLSCGFSLFSLDVM